MKLLRFGVIGQEKPGVLLPDGTTRDCSGHFGDWNAAFFASGGLSQLRSLLARPGAQLPVIPTGVRLGSCVARPGKLICIGLNYRDHAAESGMPVPAEPIIFMKGSNTVVGPDDAVMIPRLSQKTDWEVELGVVIGATARYLADERAAAACIAGYCISNDVSERAFQLERGGQWTKGKSCDTFNPLGPWLVTPDEVPDPQALAMQLAVNGQRVQNGSTATMVFGVTNLVHYLSQFMTLEPGDVLSTGTPPGVGLGMKPPRYLRAGDTMEVTISGLGRQRQTCINA
jgi:2,4-diketo-3-deoxy-L-fuconate hydrolase